MRLWKETSDFIAYVRAETDGVTLFFTLGYESLSAQEYTGAVALNVTYNGVTRTIDEQVFGEKKILEFPYDDSVKTVRLSGVDIYYGGTKYEGGKDFTWRTSFESTPPNVRYTFPGAREMSSHEFSWTITDPLGRPVAAAGLRDYYKKPTEDFWTAGTVLTIKSTAGAISNYVLSEYSAGTLMYYKFYAAVYETADAAREDYIELVEEVTAVYIVSAKNAPYQPYSLYCRTPVERAPLVVTWEHTEDQKYPTARFELERSLDGGAFALIYAGSSKSFTDTIPAGTKTVVYRVRAVGSKDSSFYCTGDTLKTVKSNLYIGVNGRAVLGSELYIGVGGAALQVTPLIKVGTA